MEAHHGVKDAERQLSFGLCIDETGTVGNSGGGGLMAHDREYFAGINTSKRFASITLWLSGKMEGKEKKMFAGGFQSMFSFCRRLSDRSHSVKSGSAAPGCLEKPNGPGGLVCATIICEKRVEVLKHAEDWLVENQEPQQEAKLTHKKSSLLHHHHHHHDL